MTARPKRIEAELRSKRVVRLNARVRPTVEIKAEPIKRTFSRCNLPDGDFLMNYYYIKDANGNFVPEDIDRATHFERIIYSRDGVPIGSTMGKLSDEVRW